MRSETGRTFCSEGVVLKRSNFGEADKIVTIYSKRFGKITCLAKGVRRMTSKKRGSLEIFNQIKFFASKGKDLFLVTEAEVVNSHSFLRKNLKKIATAYQLCELIDKLTPEVHEQEDIFDLLVIYLSRIDKTSENNLNSLLKEFAAGLLKLLGYWPKDKVFPQNLSLSSFIENIIEAELKSKKFGRMVLA